MLVVSCLTKILLNFNYSTHKCKGSTDSCPLASMNPEPRPRIVTTAPVSFII